jgi:hypothetical protein
LAQEIIDCFDDEEERMKAKNMIKDIFVPKNKQKGLKYANKLYGLKP